MPTTITYDNGVDPIRSFSVSDAVLESLEQFRLTFGGTYTDIPAMFKDFLNQFCIAPALRKFPTGAVQTALDGITTAQQNYATVLQDSISGALQE